MLETMSFDSIALLGYFSPGTLGSSYRRAFDAIGVRAHMIDMHDLVHELGWPLRNRIGHRLTIRSGFIRSRSAREANRWLEERVIESGATALLVFSMAFISAETLENLRARGIRVACFYADNPFPPHYGARPETLPAARASDVCLIWSERLVTKLREAGVPNPAFLPFAWDPEVFPYQNDRPQETWPGVLFLGGWDREREEFLDELAPYVPLRIYGPGYWKTRARRAGPARNCWQGTDLRLSEAARSIRESAISLNILRTQHIVDGEPDGLIMRHFEVPGAGGFLLSTRSGGATTLFPEGETGEYFSDVKECLDKIREYLAAEPARRQIADRAHAIVAARHQYTDRAREIIRRLEECAVRR